MYTRLTGRACIRSVIRDGRRRGRSSCPDFLLPFGHRHSLLGSSHPRRGFPPSSRSAYRTNHPARTPSGLPRSTRSRYDRGGCPLYPGDGGALPAKRPPSPAPAASQRPVPTPAGTSHRAEPTVTRHQSGVHVLHPSGLLLACDPRMERGSSGFLGAPHPAVTSDPRPSGDRP
jgi:hypothetical protein